MAGHSKWANIKRQKARVDAQKGKVFARISRAIIIAARQGVPDPDGNFQLRAAIDKAKAAGIPNENIDRAIAKGAGKLGGGPELEEIRYEAYGPAGVAILIESLTDNRNRTAADLRAAFNKLGGNLGETGCVGWMFNQVGVVTIDKPADEEAFLLDLIEVGAETYEFLDLEDDDQVAEVITGTIELEAVSQGLKAAGYQVRDAELRWQPSTSVAIDDADVGKRLLKLMDVLEDLDDVQSVTANFELDESLIEVLGI
jgi:YebC/PmpR family DNA-binding regulatory protein